MSDSGVINIHGKEYFTVAKRIAMFREKHPDYGIETDITSAADRVICKATVRAADGHILSTGFAEEERSSRGINSTSALENAETSAVGRALAFFGLQGTEIASADEVAGAISQQRIGEAVEEQVGRVKKHNAALAKHFQSVAFIKESIGTGDYSAAYEAMTEIPNEDRADLWLAPSKGGIFTTKEREIMKSSEFLKAGRGEVA